MGFTKSMVGTQRRDTIRRRFNQKTWLSKKGVSVAPGGSYPKLRNILIIVEIIEGGLAPTMAS